MALISFEDTILLISVLLTIATMVYTFFVVMVQRRKDEIRKLRKTIRDLKMHLDEKSLKQKAEINELIYNLREREDVEEIAEEIPTYEELPMDSQLFAERLDIVETKMAEVFQKLDAKKETEKILTEAQRRKIELENEKMEHDMEIERFKHYPNRAWPKWLTTIGVGLTTGSFSIGSILYSQGQNFIVVSPIVGLGMAWFVSGLYFWAKDDKERLDAYKRSFTIQ